MVQVKVIVKPSADRDDVKWNPDDRSFVISTVEPAERGRANRAIIRMLAKLFSVPSSKVKIVSGHSSRYKIIEIPVDRDELEEVIGSLV